MKKFVITVSTLALLSTASFADQNTENKAKMMQMRHQFFMMTDQMTADQMSMLKMQETMFTNYQKLLKQMMESDQGSH